MNRLLPMDGVLVHRTLPLIIGTLPSINFKNSKNSSYSQLRSSHQTYLKRPGTINIISIFRKIMKPGGIKIREKSTITIFMRGKAYHQTDAQVLLPSFKLKDVLEIVTCALYGNVGGGGYIAASITFNLIHRLSSKRVVRYKLALTVATWM